MNKKFEKFAKSDFALQIFSEDKLIFQSKEEGVRGLMSFIRKYGKQHKDIVIFDKVVGNAAALLLLLGAKEIYGVLGSQSAEKTLEEFKIKFHFKKMIPVILNKTKDDLCPMEKLSKSKSPLEFYECLRDKK